MRRRGITWAGVGLGSVALVAAPALAVTTRYVAPTNAGALPSLSDIASGTSPVVAVASSPPVRVEIASLHTSATVVPVGVDDDRALAVPRDPSRVGWWDHGARPGQPTGTVVLDGHVDTAAAGAGAMFHLARLRPGAAVVVTARGGDHFAYTVIARRVYPKNDLPAEVFDQHVAARLVLITCGGQFDPGTHHYADNVVVFAVPVSRKEPAR